MLDYNTTKLYLDISNFMNVNFLTGIQRLVSEYTYRLIQWGEEKGFCVILLYEQKRKDTFEIISNAKFCELMDGKIGKESCHTMKRITIEEMESNSIFFDMDGVWCNTMLRSYLLSKLKQRNIRIITFVHDIIAITHPQYASDLNLLYFPNYIAANIKYADALITSTEYTAKQIKKLIHQLKEPEKEIYVVPLGTDFVDDYNESEVPKEVKKVVKKGKYCLTVGTIEPRKNHQIILDMFEKFQEEEINIIFAGRIGWKMDEFMEKLYAHPFYEKRIFHFSGLNDDSIRYLYKEAYLVIFPTIIEGFGIPAIEALQFGTPLLASDIPIMHEVAGEYADYFSLEDHGTELREKVEYYSKNPDAYLKKREKLKEYHSMTWDDCGEKLLDILQHYKKKRFQKPEIKQIVFLTARKQALLETLDYVEQFMKFIKEVIICSPEQLVEEIKNSYKGNLLLKFLTDGQVLKDAKLPEDHLKRNFFLRCKAMEQEIIDDVFLMSDDDYRPLEEIKEEVFFNGRYQAYYCYNLQEWTGAVSEYTSYDYSMFRTGEFLKKQGYSTLQYSSHMPQIICKKWYLELLKEYPDIIEEGFCEWSTYFNYSIFHYSEYFDIKPYFTLKWPEYTTDWKLGAPIGQYRFENYYEELYDSGKIFQGMSKQYNENTLLENMEKVQLVTLERVRNEKENAILDAYHEFYRETYGEENDITISVTDESIQISLPQWIVSSMQFERKIAVKINRQASLNVDCSFKLKWYLCASNGNPITPLMEFQVEDGRKSSAIILKGGRRGCKLVVMCIRESTNKMYMASIPVKISNL